MLKLKVTVTNNVNAVFRRIEDNIQDAVNQTAAEAGQMIADAIGEHGGTQDGYELTGASTASVYLIYGKRNGSVSNYAEAVAKMAELWPKRNSPQHSGLAIEKFKLPFNPNAKRAATASCSRVVYYWENGHHNKWTGKFEYDPVFSLAPRRMRGALMRNLEGVISRETMVGGSGPLRGYKRGVTLQRQGGLRNRGGGVIASGFSPKGGFEKLSRAQRSGGVVRPNAD